VKPRQYVKRTVYVREEKMPLPGNEEVTLKRDIIRMQLNDGRIIMTDDLNISNTYLEMVYWSGDPSSFEESNRRKLLGSEIEKSGPDDPVIVDPVITLNLENLLLLTRTNLPLIRFKSRFFSLPVKDHHADGSVLEICWFQDEVHPFLSPKNIELMKALDWNKLARDYCD
jgi:hypothetical protein